ncbi:MAG: hypothetical protein A3J40_02820, partial [Erythrobacter sp. RIFCSPHIGHO2_12_FULL_63_10]
MSAAFAQSPAFARRQRVMVTPEGIALPVTLASRGARVGALLLDFTILYVGMLVVILLLGWMFSGLLEEAVSGLEEEVSGAAEFLLIILIMLFFLARYGYFLSMELGPRGATWGKRITGIRIAARDGGRLTAEAVIARNLLRDIELFMPLVFLMVAPRGEAGMAGLAGLAWFAMFMALPFFNRDSMRAGDIIAGTWVVEAPRVKLAHALSAQGAAKGTSAITGARYQFGDAELAIYGEHELKTLERVLREGREEAMEAVHHAICRKLGWNPGAGDERAFLEAYYSQLRHRLEADLRFGKRKR